MFSQDYSDLNPNTGYLCVWYYWRPDPQKNNPDRPGLKQMVITYIPAGPQALCKCGSGQFYANCCQTLPNSINKLRKIAQSNATWLCTVRRAPFWNFPKKQAPYRPFLVLTLDQDTELVLNIDTPDQRPTPEAVLKHLVKSMQGTWLNLKRSSRPASILLDDDQLAQAIAPQLAKLGIRCAYRSSLPQLRVALLEMEETANQRKPVPGVLSIPGVSVPLAAEFYDAAAEYAKLKPWRWMENWEPIEMRFPPEGRARYILVLGSGGETFGLSLYESLADIKEVFSRTDPAQPPSRPITWLSVVLDEETAMSIDDLDAIEQYGWPVAGKQAYPLLFKASSSESEWGRLPNATELTWLAAALRAIPDFLTRHLQADRGLPLPRLAVVQLAGVYGNQKLFLRYPPQDTPPAATDISPQSASFQPDPDLEEYIEDWHYNEASHEYARQMGAFLFKFLDYLETTGLSRPTMRKHESNCWCIGWLECSYGYHETFTPAIFLGGPFFESEFKRKVSDSKYAVDSYGATWRKLEKYIISLGLEK
jgi:hypothetical protein